MNRILILFAHPRFEKSKTNRALLKNIVSPGGITLNDLYEKYPDFNIDAEHEKKLLIDHEIIIWHHPVYMYGAPALLKQWVDIVLEYGWAHGKDGNFLKDKIIFNAVTAGGTRDVYAAGGYNAFTMREFLAPFEQTANLCKMTYLPPFVVHGTYLLTDNEMEKHAYLYNLLMRRLINEELDIEILRQYEYLNDWLLKDEGLVKT
jgi:glutathione-regulated potassium-efflux system ancillary protein KefG